MKDKIVFFVIGFLVGAVLSTGIFYVYTLTNKSNTNTNFQQTNGGQPPQKPDDDALKSSNKTSDDSTTSSSKNSSSKTK